MGIVIKIGTRALNDRGYCLSGFVVDMCYDGGFNTEFIFISSYKTI